MTKIRFQMLDMEDLAEWVHREVNLLPQPDIDGVMTLYAHLSNADRFFDEHPEISDKFSEWLEEPKEIH